MTYLTLHHSGGNQHINQPSDIGGKWQFYNIIVSPDKVFEQSLVLHPRGPFESLDVCLSGNFLTEVPTSSQLAFTKDLIKRYNYPVIGHKNLKEKGATIGILDTDCPGNLLSYLSKTMTQDEVTKLYVLAFYRAPTPDEVAFWAGKDLLAFLKQAILDRANFLQAHE